MNIYKGKDPELRVKCTVVSEFNEELRETATNMFLTMLRHQGIGLAAPQVGLNKRIIVINVKKPTILINPVIISKRGKVVSRERCLSLPSMECSVERAKMIKVKYQTGHGLKKVQEFKKLESIVIQHEINHLDGILMHDIQSEA